MFERYLTKSIRYDESVIRVLRPSWFHYRWPIAGYILLLLLALFFWYPLRTLGWIGWAAWALLTGLALWGLIRVLLIRSLTAFIITSQRILDIDHRKLFERHVSECPLENIRDIRYNKTGMVQMLYNIGTVIIETGERGHLECQDVRHPEEVKELLTRVQHHSKK